MLHGPEQLDNRVPDEYEFGRLKLGRVLEWLPEEGALFWDVFDPNRQEAPIGDLEVNYRYGQQQVRVGNVAVYNFLNQGYGKEIYEAVPKMLLPSGETFTDTDFEFMTVAHSDKANRVWESFVRQGKAIRLDPNKREYIWIKEIGLQKRPK